LPHPLDQLTVDEVNAARRIILDVRHPTQVVIRDISLQEPPKALLWPYLEAEHGGAREKELAKLRPPRIAKALYDTISLSKEHSFCESIIDLGKGREISMEIIDKKFHAPMSA